ncbi:MAG TPA: M48 family metallopeptidase [Stellaceae bacterium]|nr:M48 family metallopeptidase [Stellaceae bacterium]
MSLTPEGLRLDEGIGAAAAGAEGGEVWPYRALSLRADELRHGPVRLAYGDARLTVEDKAFGAALVVAAPALRRAQRRSLIYGSIATAALLAAVGGLWWGLPAISGRIVEHIPPSWEEKLGDAVELEPVWGPRCSTAAGSTALDRLTRRLLSGAELPFPVTVIVRDSKVVNAYALPGGHIVLLRGLLDQAESPDEVAGVLAHELTHTIKRHPMRALVANSGLALLIEVTLGNGTGASLGYLLTSLHYSRAMEAEADDGAVHLLQHAGIGTEGFAAFFERMEKRATGPKLPYLSTHPPDAQRLAAVRATATQGSRPALSEADWKALKDICPAD